MSDQNTARTTFPVDETTLVFAFRYALGRRSAAPSHIVCQLRHHWPRLASWTQRQIQSEVRSYIQTAYAAKNGPHALDTWQEVLMFKLKPEESET